MNSEDGGRVLLQAKETSHRVQSEITETERSLNNLISPAPSERTPSERTPSECSTRNSHESKENCTSCANYVAKNVRLQQELRKNEETMVAVRANVIVLSKNVS